MNSLNTGQIKETAAKLVSTYKDDLDLSLSCELIQFTELFMLFKDVNINQFSLEHFLSIYRVSIKLLYSLTSYYTVYYTILYKLLYSLRNVIVPALKQRPDFNKLYFQQDGAPPHYATAVRNLLDETFPDKWIGRRGPIEFPPQSPDITPMDFFVWGVIKDSVYSRKPRSVEDLRQFVIDAFANLDHDLCTKVCHSVVSHCRECIKAEGLQFEYLS